MARKGGKDRGLFQRKGDKAWWIRWQCHLGHDHQEKIGTKTFARHMHAQRRQQVRERQFCLKENRAKRLQISEAQFKLVSDRYMRWAQLERPRSLGMRKTAIKHLVAYFGDTSLARITRADIERFRHRCIEAGMSPSSINKCKAVLGSIFGKANDWGLVENNPTRGIGRIRERNISPRPITEAEEAIIYEVFPEHYHALITLALHTGLRTGELRAQRWSDIDLVDASLTVTQPKSGEYEVLPLNDIAHALLAGLPQESEVIFPRMPKDMSKMFRHYAKKAGLPQDLTFHCLRDTYISRLAPYCTGPTLMQLARHRSFATTQRYLRVDERHFRQIVNRLVREEKRITHETQV